MHARELGPAHRVISLAAFSFIVQEPIGIIDTSTPMSLPLETLQVPLICVSEAWLWNTGG